MPLTAEAAGASENYEKQILWLTTRTDYLGRAFCR
jgi:hypothetical protein